VLFFLWPWWKERQGESQLTAGIRKEIAINIEQLGRKLEMLAYGPLVGVEPNDAAQKALTRLERAKNLQFETKFYDANVSALLRLESREWIDKFYRRLGMAKKLEPLTIALVRNETRAASLGIMGAYPEHHLASVEDYYMLLFLYGSELLVQKMKVEGPPQPLKPIAKLDVEKRKIEAAATQAAAKQLNLSAFGIIDGRLAVWDEFITRADSAKTRLPSYKE
jgi:hypothetical protein